MGEKDTILKEKFSHKGIGNFKDFYNFMYNWLSGEGFGIVENKYSEKIAGDAKDIEISWDAEKKLTDYFKASVNVSIAVAGLKEIEVEINGKREKTNEFQALEVTLKGVLEKDPSSKWEGTAMQKFFKEVYHKYIIPGRTEQMEDKVAGYVQDMKEDMKQFFDLTARR